MLDKNQIQNLLIAAQEEQPEFLALYQLSITTDMRLGELHGISWEDLDWDKGTLTINRQLKMNKGKGLVLTPPKTQSGRRTIKLGEATLALLSDHQKNQYKTLAFRDPDWETNKLVFAENNSNPIGPRKIQKAFKRILAASGLPTIRFHSPNRFAGNSSRNNRLSRCSACHDRCT